MPPVRPVRPVAVCGHLRIRLGSVTDMAIDVTDATFQAEVIHKSAEVPVVIDLWAPWCGPCTTLGPILEKVIDATGGQVVLAKVNIDENPGISKAFQVQSIPAVFAMQNGQIVDGFVGAVPEREVQAVRRSAAADEGGVRGRRAARRRRRGQPAPGDRARARQRGRDRRARPAARRPAAVRRGPRAARSGSRSRSAPDRSLPRRGSATGRSATSRPTTTTPAHGAARRR